MLHPIPAVDKPGTSLVWWNGVSSQGSEGWLWDWMLIHFQCSIQGAWPWNPHTGRRNTFTLRNWYNECCCPTAKLHLFQHTNVFQTINLLSYSIPDSKWLERLGLHTFLHSQVSQTVTPLGCDVLQSSLHSRCFCSTQLLTKHLILPLQYLQLQTLHSMICDARPIQHYVYEPISPKQGCATTLHNDQLQVLHLLLVCHVHWQGFDHLYTLCCVRT